MSAPPAGRVLVVDDDPVVLEIYRLALQRAGFTVTVARDGIAALQAVSQEAPDFIFLDVKMPRLDGMEVLTRLKAGDGTKDIPVVMLSNFDDPKLVRESLRIGAKEYFVKTAVSPSSLSAIATRWLQSEAP